MSTEPSTDVSFHAPARGDSPCFELVVEAGPDAGARLRVDGSLPDRSLVGQSAANDLVLSDRQVSRRHFAVEVKGDLLRIDDLGSTNGTLVAGVRVVQALLAGGERIVVGQTTLTLARVAPDAPAEVPPARAFGRVIGASLAMRRVYPMLEKLARSDAGLLLEGETGTGKELVAEALHERGPRGAGPFVVFDCAAAVDELGPARLLGDARAGTPGVFELAHGGTLVLDEVGELNLELQPLLLRALQRGEVQRLGEAQARRISVRVIATTRLDLERAIQEGTFRDDLFYRLATTRLELPPLRERAGDVGILARHFWTRLGGDAAAMPYEAFESLERGTFPGNVRELLGAVTRLVTFGADGDAPKEEPEVEASLAAFCARDVPYARAKERLLAAFTRAYVDFMVREHGSVQRAAAASGLALRYFQLLRARANEREP